MKLHGKCIYQYALLLILSQTTEVIFGLTYINSSITGTQHWTLNESPFIIVHNDLIINPKSKLIIDPGVRILIGAGLSIKVKGVIYAKGTSDRRIVFTKWSASDKHNSPLENNVNEAMILPRINMFTDQPYHKIRLVNGKCINQGELQIWLASKWRSVCSQNNEWSKIDSRIACQQLGYFNGNFSLGAQSFNRYPSVQIIKPTCFGNETNKLGLFSCPGLMENISYGRNICDLQDLVNLNCWGVNRKQFIGYWKGIEIINATHKEVNIPEEWGGTYGNTRLNVSASIFEYVDIQFAGVNRSNYQSAALISTPYPPVLYNVRFAYNAHHAINFQRIRGPAILENVTTENNHGHGIKITSIMGYIRLKGVTSLRNNGDGLNIKLFSGSHYHWSEETLEFIHKAYWVCRPGSIPASPVFPFLMIAELPGPTFRTSGMCEFHVASDQTDQIITINLLETIHDPIASGRIEIWDKLTMNQIANWSLVNQKILNNYNNHTNYPSLVFHRNSGPLKGLVYQGVSSIRNAILIKFIWKKLTDRFVCSEFANCIRALLHISVGQTKLAEVILKNSIISENNQHGLLLYNPWTYIHLENNTFEQNQYEAGVKILGGSADILINNNQFVRNQNSGLNISVNGGFKQINNSLFHSNYGHGLVIWNLNQSDLSSLRQPNLPLKTHVHLSNFTENYHDAIRFYNSCLRMEILVNFTYFFKNHRNAIRVYSCLCKDLNVITNFTLGFSYFNTNQLNAIIISPMVNIIGKIINSTFEQHLHGVIYMDNSDNLFKSEQLREFPIAYIISYNEFQYNHGSYVVHLSLTETSKLQRIELIYNKFINNRVQIKSSSLLKPRSTCPAVIVIGSSNVHIFRNHLWNPYSDIELASHLSSPDKQINATLNYWGNLQDWSMNDWSTVHKIVFNKIFDQNHRYTLAKINYHPLLKDLNLRSNFITSNEPPYISNFIQTTTSVNEPIYLGGRIPIEQSREVILKPMQNPKRFYRVTKDIFIPPTGRLIIEPGVKLFFDSGVGLFSQGELKLEGTLTSPIIFDHYSQVRLNNDEIQGHFINHANFNKSIPNNTVRLSGGEWSRNNNSYYGRLEVWISRINQISSSEYGHWATVCEDGFNEHALMLACLNIGLVANPKSWLPPVSIREATIEKANRLMNRSRSSLGHITYIDCQGYETDLSECEYNYEPIAYPLQTCMNSMDLVIQCHRPGWSGIRITASDSGSRTIISHVQIHHAGLLDYTRLEYMPSLQLDYFSGTINKLKITDSLSNGLVILYSNPLLGTKIINSQFIDNFESGLLTYTPWFSLINCQITNSQINSGLQYNRIMTVEQRFAFHAGIVPTLTLFHNIEENSNTITTTRVSLPEGWSLVETYEKLSPNGIIFVNVPVGKSMEKTIYRTELSINDAYHFHQIIIDLLEFPGSVKLPTSQQQAVNYPKACIGPSITLNNSILPAIHYNNNNCNRLNKLHCINTTIITKEELIIYDSGFVNFNPIQVYNWRIPKDLIRLPLISSTNKLIMELRVDGLKSGQFLFSIQVRNLFHQHKNYQMNDYLTTTTTFGRMSNYDHLNVHYSLKPKFHVENTTLEDNLIGVKLYHYNDPMDKQNNHFWRNEHETFIFDNVKIRNNLYTGMNILSVTQFTDSWFHPNYKEFKQSVEHLSFINYNITNCEFAYNNYGSLLVEHNPIEYSNNIWSYHITNNKFIENGLVNNEINMVHLFPFSLSSSSSAFRMFKTFQHGLQFYLPFISNELNWRYESGIINHQISLLHNQFNFNKNFHVQISGYTAKLNIENNQFLENYCQNVLPGEKQTPENGLVQSYGMEREIILSENYFLRNKNCSYIIQLKGESQSRDLVTVQSFMKKNILQDNEICMNSEKRFQFVNPWECYTMGVFGTQNITIRHNRFENCKSISVSSNPCYELIAGIQSIQIPNFLDAQQNYWASSNITEIRQHIFDFNQWNSFSLINFNNYLTSFHPITNHLSLKLSTPTRMNPLNVEEILNGRIESDLFVPSRLKPYRIMSDITVMPGVELQIEAGVKFEFAPHIGLLVLGRIEALGTLDSPIIFTSINNTQLENNQFNSMIKSNLMFTKLRKPKIVNTNNNHKPTTETYLSVGRITLSTETVRLIGGEQSNEGFVQFFNYSTKNWYIACDKQFSTRVAQVVCSEFNVSTLAAIVRFSNLYDHYVYGFQNLLNIKHIWMESYTCNGFESKLAYCRRRLNYDAVQCLKRKDFAFLRCIPQINKTLSIDKKIVDLSTSTWGNIRIVQPNSEHYPVMLPNNPMTYTKKQSVLEYVNIENAGLLHGERVPALTIVYAYPKLSFIKINNCFDSGLEIITPNGPIKVTNCTISKCLGRGLGLTIFNSDSTDPVTIGTENSKSFYNNPSTFPPEQHSLFPLPQPSSGHILFNNKLSNEFARSPLSEYPFKNEEILFGFIAMCSSEKVINVLDRVLVQFKYSSWLNGIHSCTKVFRSIIPGRRLAWRFLAVNLYYDPLVENFIQLYNGVNQTANQMITVITQDTLSMNENYLANKHYTFITSPIHDEFSVYVHTSSVSDDKYGFIAEIISLPLSVGRKQQEMNRFIKHEIDTCEFHHNQEGGLRITSIGEFGPDIHLSNLRLEENGLVMLNLTGPSAIELYLTNSRNLVIQNSYIAKHSGDIINMVLFANQLTNGIQANLTNNVIVRNKLGSVLQAHGNHFNAIQVLRNYIAHNDCGYRTMIHINGLLSQPFANNFIYDNRADILLKCEGNENLNQYSIYQKNGFYNNQALNITKRTTIFCKNSKNIFRYNYFRNILNDYELVTGNQSIISVLPIQSGFQCPTSPYTSCPQGWKLRLEYDACICYRPDQIDAQYNWWGDTSSSSSSLPTVSSLSNNQLLLMNSVKSTNITIHNENHNQITSQNFAQNRIYDHQDDLYLIKVNYAHSYLSNSSTLGQGIYCPPNWDFYEFNCFYYFGAPMTYQEANDFCLSEVDGILATSQDRTDWLGKMLGEWQHNYDWINRYTWVTRAWVDSDAQFPTHCTVIRNGWLEPYPCNKKIGFFCQKTPYVSYSGAQPVVVALLGLMGSLLALSIALLLVGWFVKSRRRHSQKLLTAYNRSSWLRQCYSRIGNDDWFSQIQNVNNTANASPNRQYYSAVSEDSPVNLKSKNYTLNKYNSYEDHLNDNLTSRYYSRNTDHRRKQRASEHQDVKCHKAEKSLIDDGFIFTHNADSESVKLN
ncbi:unnamed protein product [Schistosoma bovis]|nr:unnamed protein product [Schistosoma bovis]